MPLNDKEHNAEHPGCTKAFKNLSSLSNNIAPAVSGLFGKHNFHIILIFFQNPAEGRTYRYLTAVTMVMPLTHLSERT